MDLTKIEFLETRVSELEKEIRKIRHEAIKDAQGNLDLHKSGNDVHQTLMKAINKNIDATILLSKIMGVNLPKEIGHLKLVKDWDETEKPKTD